MFFGFQCWMVLDHFGDLFWLCFCGRCACEELFVTSQAWFGLGNFTPWWRCLHVWTYLGVSEWVFHFGRAMEIEGFSCFFSVFITESKLRHGFVRKYNDNIYIYIHTVFIYIYICISYIYIYMAGSFHSTPCRSGGGARFEEAGYAVSALQAPYIGFGGAIRI